MNEKARKESTISVQSRVSIIDLAKLDWLFSREGILIRSMSDLIRKSMELLVNELINSGKLSNDTIPTVASADKYLRVRGLYQLSHIKKSASRLNMALRFESMRKEGLDPESEHPRAFHQIHGNPKENMKGVMRTVDTSPYPSDRQECKYLDDTTWEKIKVEKQRLRHEEFIKSKEEAIRNARDSNMIVDCDESADEEIAPGEGIRAGTRYEDLDKYDAERDRRRIEAENAPMDISKIKIV